MASLRDYFDTDFKFVLSTHRGRRLKSKVDEAITVVVERLHLDFNSNTKYISYFIPQTENAFSVCITLIENTEWALSLNDSVLVKYGHVDQESIGSSAQLRFSSRVFLYSNNELSNKDEELLYRRAGELDIALVVKGPKYAQKRAAVEKPLAFICHDSRDKDEIARPLAVKLSEMVCPVWFDEFSLKIGDNLRASIEKGIKECRKCIVVLSPYFFTNDGWTKTEFDSIYIREIIKKDNVMLPVWHNVNKEEVYEYSPKLANILGIPWTLGTKEVARQLYKVIMT